MTLRRTWRLTLLILILAWPAREAFAQPVAPSIASQPTGQNVSVGQTAIFTVAASGNPSPSIQWQTSADQGTTWSNLADGAPYAGAATPALSVTVAANLLGRQYRAIATNSAGTATSNAAILLSSLLYVLTDATPAFFPPSGNAAVVAINPATGNSLATMELGPRSTSIVRDLAVMPSASRGFVSDGDAIVAFDVKTNTIIQRFAPTASPAELALSADGSRLFVADNVVNTIAVVDTTTFAVVNTINVPDKPREMVVSPDGTRLYVLPYAAAVHVIGLASMAVTATIATPPRPVHIGVHPNGTKLYIVSDNPTPSGLFQPMDGNLAVVDTQSLTITGSMALPPLVAPALPCCGWYTVRISAPAFLPDGSRLYIPQWAEGGRTSPTGFVHRDEILVIDPAQLTLVTRLAPPAKGSLAGPLGASFVAAIAPGPQVLTIGPQHLNLLDSVSNAFSVLRDGGVASVSAVAATSLPACWFEVGPPPLYVRNSSVTVNVPASPSCSWTATTPAPWLSITGGSGVGPGSFAVQASSSIDPRTTTLTVAHQTLSLHQLVAQTTIDLPKAGAVSMPFDFRGWGVDRILVPPAGSTNAGIDSFELWDLAEPVSGRPETILAVLLRENRPDIVATFGPAYSLAGFSKRLTRLPVGAHTFQVRAKSAYDGTIAAVASVSVTVSRKPEIILDSPGNGVRVLQPFRMSGWAVDTTAAQGTGVDAVHLYATPAGGMPVFVTTLPYGLNRGDVANAMGGDNGFAPSGFDGMVAGLPPGTYTLSAYAHCLATGTLDAVASVQVTIDGAPAFGAFDTPASSVTVSGAIPVTGWALDDVGVQRVQIWRNCVDAIDRPRGACFAAVPGGPADFVYIGDSAFLPGARPDIEQMFKPYPQSSRAGWGYLMSTNALPHVPSGAASGGQGTFTLSAYAIDVEGQFTLLNTKTITIDNDNATIPFGVLDTPTQGGTVTVSLFASFGWAMTQIGKCIDVAATTSWKVYIDGVSLPLVPNVNWFPGLTRPDVAAAYPGRCNTNNALAAYYIDAAALGLSNGLHTTGWDVIDDKGNIAGIGSRFFNVLIGAGGSGRAGGSGGTTDVARRFPGLSAVEGSVANMASERPRPLGHAAALAMLAPAARDVRAQIGSDAAPFVSLTPGVSGGYRLQFPSGGRIALDLGGPADAGYQVGGDELRALPAGSTFDRANGTFAWQPPVPFLGPFHLVFTSGAGRIDVRVTIVDPIASSPIAMHVDTPAADSTVSGSFVIAVVYPWSHRTGRFEAAPAVRVTVP